MRLILHRLSHLFAQSRVIIITGGGAKRKLFLISVKNFNFKKLSLPKLNEPIRMKLGISEIMGGKLKKKSYLTSDQLYIKLELKLKCT